MVEELALSALRTQGQNCDFGNGASVRFSQNGSMDLDEIRKALKKPGKSQAGLARALGINPSGVNRLLAGDRQLKISEIEKVRGYLDDKLTPPLPKEGASVPKNHVTNVYSEGLLKVLGLAECGADGWAVWNGEIVDWVPRPPNLAGAKDAYAVFIIGDSMFPRYHPGEVAHINPARPVTPGAYVLIQKRPRGPGEAPLAVIKRLVKRSGDRVILEQHNPPKTITLLAADIVSMHRVVGSAEA